LARGFKAFFVFELSYWSPCTEWPLSATPSELGRARGYDPLQILQHDSPNPKQSNVPMYQNHRKRNCKNPKSKSKGAGTSMNAYPAMRTWQTYPRDKWQAPARYLALTKTLVGLQSLLCRLLIFTSLCYEHLPVVQHRTLAFRPDLRQVPLALP